MMGVRMISPCSYPRTRFLSGLLLSDAVIWKKRVFGEAVIIENEFLRGIITSLLAEKKKGKSHYCDLPF
jgi:hypothetical protein